MKRLAATAFALALFSGCTQMAPHYTPSIENAQILRDSGTTKARVGKFDAGSGTANNDAISLRGAQMISPVGGKYTAYLEEALRMELGTAQLLDEKSSIEIGGALLKNDIDVSGISEGTAEIEARIMVRRDGQMRYDKVKSARIVFESSFAGAVAIPRAMQSYPGVVQKLLSMLYSDKDFIAALK